MRILNLRELNRALLARQALLERVRAPLPRVVERMGGIQAQYAPSAYIGLWSRVDGFERGDLTRALERRTLVQGTLLRGTIHIVSRRDYWAWFEAIREPQREWLRRAWPAVAAVDVDDANARLREALANGPRKRDDLIAEVGKERWQRADVAVLRVPPSGTWENRRAHLFALAEEWIGPNDVDVDAARELLVRRYLAAFGPATLADIRNWASLRTEDVHHALESIGPRRFRDERGKELFDLRRAPLPDPETPAPPRFVGTWDAMLLAHARRTGVLPEEYRPRIFHTKAPQSFNTFLLGGAVAGTWRHERGRIELKPFRRLTRSERRELEEEAARLTAFHA